MHLRKHDPQFATQDAMDEALEQGLFSTAAKVCVCGQIHRRRRATLSFVRLVSVTVL